MAVTKTTTYDKEYTIDKFTGDGTVVWPTPARVKEVEYLVVAGAGGGGSAGAGSGDSGGGGGAGGMRIASNFPVSGNNDVTVGAGGAAITVGNDSAFSTIIAKGGGKGAGGAGGAGGSGGGGGSIGPGAGGSGTAGQGNNGGGGGADSAGGGGGKSAAGAAGSGSVGGKGGDGLASAITGSSVIYAGGGGGGGGATRGNGGAGGGGDGGVDSAGLPGTNDLGGGGGGGHNAAGGIGGSGIVILRYRVSPPVAEPTPAPAAIRNTGFGRSLKYPLKTSLKREPVNVHWICQHDWKEPRQDFSSRKRR